MTILWGWVVGPCPGIVIKFTLWWWMMVAGGPFFGDQEELVILIFFNWNGELLVSFPRPFGGSLVEWVVCIGRSLDWYFQDRIWEVLISRLLWLYLTGMCIWVICDIYSVLWFITLVFLFLENLPLYVRFGVFSSITLFFS